MAAGGLLPAAIVHVKPLAPWSVGQLAPRPDLTRQCAFDLRSRLEILATAPDGPGPGPDSRRSGGLLLPWPHGAPSGAREI